MGRILSALVRLQMKKDQQFRARVFILPHAGSPLCGRQKRPALNERVAQDVPPFHDFQRIDWANHGLQRSGFTTNNEQGGLSSPAKKPKPV